MNMPDALLLVGPGCPHCAAVMETLCKLVKEQRIGRLEVVNVASHPDLAAQLGTRSVPWTRIGPFVLEGLRNNAELSDWAEHASKQTGMDRYLSELMEDRKLHQVLELVREQPPLLSILVGLAGDLETPMGVRIAIGALMEDLQGSVQLQRVVPELSALTRSSDQQVRADACHYLGLSASPAAREFIQPLLSDPDAEVREIARESMELLTKSR